MERKYNYFYRIDNKINGNFYYGVHKTNNLDDGYMGSGVRITYAKKKYGIENFEKHILEFFDTYKEALELESEIVNESLLLDASCYNLALGGKSDTGYLKQGPSLKHKITGELINTMNMEEYKSLWDTGDYDGFSKNKVLCKDKNNKYFLINKEEYDNNKDSYICTIYGKKCYSDINGKLYFLEDNDPIIKLENLTKTGTFLNKTHSDKTKQKIKETMSKKDHQKGEKNSAWGTCMIYNLLLKQNKRIKKEELSYWINLGWIKGAKFKWDK